MINTILIWTLKLLSGEEIIGKFVNENSTTIVLEEIKVITPGTDSNGELSIRISPWLLTSMKPEHSIDKKFIISECPTDNTIAAQYIQETSGLTVYKLKWQ
jgi:hypothetical protein